ncbi:TRAP transporter small permease [Bacillus sp. T33-2]|uniref:TRAP transporter small permease n=1 Tax=Bacillus sp. T33-2 TaxID=2054168 RepID=UPI000C78697E|nr:TRAP transporter small permease [Bacillus sp. T33-2]PLR92010.1 TRAP transporter small permease [Bacillus sp. T33-2]
MQRVNHILNYFEEYVGVVSIIFTSLMVFVQVILRYVFNYSLSWSEEIARYLIVWFVFIGSSIAVREKAHATMDALVTYLPETGKRIFSILANFLSIIFCIILIWSGSGIVSSVIEFGNVTPAIGLPMYLPYLAIPVGASLMLIRFLQLLIQDVKGLISTNRSITPPKEEASKL